MKSVRLLTASKYIKGFKYLADIGTDHAKLPIFCVENNYVDKAIASDNKLKPLENAISNIEKAGLKNYIIANLAEGMVNLDKAVDIVSILGMGGRMIVSILSEADLTSIKRLVLSANSENENLRDFLEKNNWCIIDEELVKENNKYYQIVICEPGKMDLSPIEKEFGPKIIQSKSLIFQEMILKTIKKLEQAVVKASNNKTKDSIKKRIAELEEVLS